LNVHVLVDVVGFFLTPCATGQPTGLIAPCAQVSERCATVSDSGTTATADHVHDHVERARDRGRGRLFSSRLRHWSADGLDSPRAQVSERIATVSDSGTTATADHVHVHDHVNVHVDVHVIVDVAGSLHGAKQASPNQGGSKLLRSKPESETRANS
jgi:hypothetical protein